MGKISKLDDQTFKTDFSAKAGFPLGIFFRGEKSTVTLTFLLFSDQISGGGSLPPLAVEESQKA